MIRYSYLDSPLGDLLAVRDEQGLRALHLPTGRNIGSPQPGWTRDDHAFADARGQLGEYFAGTRREFTLPLNGIGSKFQHQVWDVLLGIGYGETRSYGSIAAELSLPNAARAVGVANGQNQLPIVIPCHRVIGANGSLTGYGGGLDAKRWLLELEAAHTGLFAEL